MLLSAYEAYCVRTLELDDVPELVLDSINFRLPNITVNN